MAQTKFKLRYGPVKSVLGARTASPVPRRLSLGGHPISRHFSRSGVSESGAPNNLTKSIAGTTADEMKRKESSKHPAASRSIPIPNESINQNWNLFMMKEDTS